jgi:Zn-dependent M28 family amino/carboxypeptidase
MIGAATLLALACASLSTSDVEVGAELPPGFEEAEGSINAEDLRRDVAQLADDAMGGRGPGSEGDHAAQQYLVDRLQEIGLEPGMPDGSWRQPFAIVGITSTVPATWSFQGPTETLSLDYYEDFIAASGTQSDASVIADAELVFVGYGIVAPEYSWDDYKGQDMTGKVLVMLNNDPDWDPALFAGTTRLYYGRWSYKYEQAARVGAAGAIIIHTTPSAGYPFQVVQTSWSGEQFELPAEGPGRSAIEAWVTEDAARQLFTLAGLDLDGAVESARSAEFVPQPLGLRTGLRLSNAVTRTETANVVARLAGTDPALAEQTVVWTAHHDHLGTSSDTSLADRIYNGALDNASGVAQVLEIAQALTRIPTRRSHLFVFVAAEEQGLLGSEYYATHPTMSAGRMAANLNFDGGNIWGPTSDVTFIGYGKSSLDSVVDAGAARQGRVVKADQFPDRGFFYRSDQFNFAKIGVPAIYLDTGTSFVGRPEGWGAEQIEAWEGRDYHQVSDELTAEWNFEGMTQEAQLGLYCGVVIANSDALPAWQPGDEFEAARLAALEGLQ